MADGLNLLGPAELTGFRRRNADVLEGPTPQEVAASPSTAGSGLNLDPQGRDSIGLGEVASRIIGAPMDLLGTILTGRSPSERRAESEALHRQQSNLIRAETAQRNTEALVRGVAVLAPIVRGIANETDPARRDAIAAQIRPQIVSDLGETTGLVFDAMVNSQSMSNLPLEEIIGKAATHSPSFGTAETSMLP
jgi:hypothetical protein